MPNGNGARRLVLDLIGRNKRAIEPEDAKSDFKSSQHPLDDFLKRHALRNDRDGIGRTYVLARSSEDDPDLPALIGFYTLSMANISAESVAPVLNQRLPRYPMGAALFARRLSA